MKVKIFHILLFFLIYFTCEDFVLKWIPINDFGYSVSRQLGEIFIYLFFIFFILIKSGSMSHLKKTPLDLYFVGFIVVFIITTVINNVSFITGFIAFKAMFRYLAIFYIAVNLNPKEKYANLLIKCIIVIVVFQGALGVIQHFMGNDFRNFFLPRESSFEIEGIRKDFRILTSGENQRTFGTFGHNVPFAIFLFMSVTFLYASLQIKHFIVDKKSIVLIIIVVAVSVFFSYSRASLLLLALGFPLTIILSRKIYRGLYLSIVVFLLLLIPISLLIFTSVQSASMNNDVNRVSPVSELGTMFTSEYYEKEASNNRLWVISEVLPILMTDFSLVGYGGDLVKARQTIYEKSNNSLKRVLTYRPLKDVYYVTILIFYGVIGLIFFIAILIKLFLISNYVYRNELNNSYKVVALGNVTIILLLSIMSILVVVFEFRSVSYLFWLINGLIVGRYLHLKNAHKNLT